MQLKDKVAIVTGAASGMGAAIARRFSLEGAQVVLTDVQDHLGAEVAESCGGVFVHQDVADEAGWKSLMTMIETQFGHLDILVNNAGILSGKSIENIDLDSWNRTMNVNVTGPMLGCQAAIGLMRKNPQVAGSIIGIASTAAFAALPEDIAYTASKSAITMMSKSVAVWCAKQGVNIRCNTIHPGAIRTAIHDDFLATAEDPDALLALFGSMAPMGRMGTPDEIAATAVFLASDAAGFVTGSSYLVDGGMMSVHPGM